MWTKIFLEEKKESRMWISLDWNRAKAPNKYTRPLLWTHWIKLLTCNHSVDTFIQQRHGRGTAREEETLLLIYARQIKPRLPTVKNVYYYKGISSHLWIRLVRGSISFFPNRGSRGVSAPNCQTQRAPRHAVDYFSHKNLNFGWT